MRAGADPMARDGETMTGEAPPPVLRPATAADMAAITAIYGDAVRNGTASYELEPPDAAEMTRRWAGLAAAGYPYLVAADADVLLGYAYAGPFRARPAYRFTTEDSVYVAPAAKRRGVGRLLLGALLAACEEAGFRQMVAVIGDAANQSGSVRLHAALGFRHAGTLAGTGFKHGRWLDTAFMQSALNAGSRTPPGPAALPERPVRASS